MVGFWTGPWTTNDKTVRWGSIKDEQDLFRGPPHSATMFRAISAEGPRYLEKHEANIEEVCVTMILVILNAHGEAQHLVPEHIAGPGPTSYDTSARRARINVILTW